MQFDYEISLDIFRRNYVEIESRQYDDMSRRIKILVTKEGEPITIPSGTELRCEVKKPDGTFVKTNCAQVTESGNPYVVMALTFNMLAVYGQELIDIVMTHNNQILGTISFINRIRKAAVQDDDVMSTSEAQELVEAMAESVAIREETAASAAAARESKQSAAGSAEVAARKAAEAQSSATSAAISKDAAEAIAQDLAAQSGVSGTIRINGVLYATNHYVENGIPYTKLSEVANE